MSTIIPLKNARGGKLSISTTDIVSEFWGNKHGAKWEHGVGITIYSQDDVTVLPLQLFEI